MLRMRNIDIFRGAKDEKDLDMKLRLFHKYLFRRFKSMEPLLTGNVRMILRVTYKDGSHHNFNVLLVNKHTGLQPSNKLSP